MTKNLHNDAVNLLQCPRCQEGPGKSCRNPSGKMNDGPHRERLRELISKPTFNHAEYGITVIQIRDILRRINR